MKYLIIFSLFLSSLSLYAKNMGPKEIQKHCSHYANLKSNLTRANIKESCKKIDNTYSLACSKIAITYMYKEDQKKLIDSCAKIKSERALKCVVKDALQAKKYHAKKIRLCS